MILLDENVHQQSIVASIAAWYRGQVRSLTTLRPNTLIRVMALAEPRRVEPFCFRISPIMAVILVIIASWPGKPVAHSITMPVPAW